MSKVKKLDLIALEVKSFLTLNQTKELKGGSATSGDSNNFSVGCPNGGGGPGSGNSIMHCTI